VEESPRRVGAPLLELQLLLDALVNQNDSGYEGWNRQETASGRGPDRSLEEKGEHK